MAHKKAAGSSRNGRDSAGQRLGIKVFGTLPVTAGSIIVRQRGTLYRAGKNVYAGRDHSLLAAVQGTVQFSQRRVRKYDGRIFRTTFVHVNQAQ